LLACSHLGGFFLFLYLAVAEPTAKAPAAGAVTGASAAPGIVTFVLASANTSWSSWETSSNSVSNGIFANFPFPFQVWTFCMQSCSTQIFFQHSKFQNTIMHCTHTFFFSQASNKKEVPLCAVI
jgi:hypothetical protein